MGICSSKVAPAPAAPRPSPHAAERAASFLPVTSRDVWPDGSQEVVVMRRDLVIGEMKKYNGDMVWLKLTVDMGSETRGGMTASRSRLVPVYDLRVPSMWYITVHVALESGEEVVVPFVPVSSDYDFLVILASTAASSPIAGFLATCKIGDRVPTYGPRPSGAVFHTSAAKLVLLPPPPDVLPPPLPDAAPPPVSEIAVTSLLCIAAGAALTTFVQLVERTMANTASRIVIQLIHCVDTVTDILLLRELRILVALDPDRLSLVHVVAKPAVASASMVFGTLSADIIRDFVTTKPSVALVAGPPEFAAQTTALVCAATSLPQHKVVLFNTTPATLASFAALHDAGAAVTSIFPDSLAMLPHIAATTVRENPDLISIHGLVLNIASFRQHHPGGVDVFARASAVVDASPLFDAVGHSARALAKLESLAVGLLEHDALPYVLSPIPVFAVGSTHTALTSSLVERIPSTSDNTTATGTPISSPVASFAVDIPLANIGFGPDDRDFIMRAPTAGGTPPGSSYATLGSHPSSLHSVVPAHTDVCGPGEAKKKKKKAKMLAAAESDESIDRLALTQAMSEREVGGHAPSHSRSAPSITDAPPSPSPLSSSSSSSSSSSASSSSSSSSSTSSSSTSSSSSAAVL